MIVVGYHRSVIGGVEDARGEDVVGVDCSAATPPKHQA